MRPGDDQLGGDDRSDAGFVEQRRGKRMDVLVDLVFELVGFEGCGLDAAGRGCAAQAGS